MLNNMEGVFVKTWLPNTFISYKKIVFTGEAWSLDYFKLFDDSHLFCVYQVKRDYHKESLCERARANSMDLSTDGTVNMLIKLFAPPGK